MRKGFTLIELLVAIAIMVMITAVSLVAFSGARASGRDAKRKADLEAIRSALELYRNDNGGYPTTVNFNSGVLTPTYMASMPTDPQPSTNNYSYTASGTCGTYCTAYSLCANLETASGSGVSCGSCGSGGSCDYLTTNP